MNKNRKGFTIVELVIVIAIIAILAAVLIPTFASLIQKANISKDTQVIRNLNTAIATATEKPETMRDALKIAAEAGYLVDKINAAANGNDILWDSENKVFCYYNVATGTPAYIPETKVDNAKTPVYKFWKVYDEKHPVPEADKQTYSVYWAGTAAPGVTAYKVGFDAGNCTEALDITYTNTTAGQNVMFYMNGGKLMVEDTNDNNQQYFYGSLAEAVVKTGKSCFHAYGTVAKLDLQAGKVVAEAGSIVMVSNAVSGTKVEKSNGSVVMRTSSATVDTNAKVAESSDEEKSAYVLEISDAAGLAAFRDSVNSGMTYAGLTVKLTADIDLGNKNWLPIGNYRAAESFDKHTFNGTFDGQNHTISGLFIDGDNYPAKYKNGDSVYGALFGYICNAKLKNFTVKGVVFGTEVAGVVGALGANCTVDGVVADVTVGGNTGENEQKLARGKVGGIIIATKGDGSTIKNCINNGDVRSNESKGKNRGDYAGGIIALIQHATTIENCKNTGAVTTKNYYVGGIVGAASDTSDNKAQFNVTIKNCENTGNITLTEPADGANGKDYGVGAIIGACGAASAVSIDNCTNEKGEITGNQTYDINLLVGVNYPTKKGKDVTGVTKRENS